MPPPPEPGSVFGGGAPVEVVTFPPPVRPPPPPPDGVANVVNDRAVAQTTTIPPDLEAPEITLLGPGSVQVDQGVPFVDRGATAIDAREGVLPIAASVDSVDTSVAGVYVVTYEACDSSGNCVGAERVVEVVNPCPPGEVLCPGDPPTCSTAGGVCGISGINVVEDEQAEQEFVPLEDTTPPEITLSAPPAEEGTRFLVSAAGNPVVEQIIPIFEVFSDNDGPYGGYLAQDETADGSVVDLTKQVTATLDRPLDTSKATSPTAPFSITYTVTDRSGNVALAATRLLHVVDPCEAEGLVTCESDRTKCRADCTITSLGGGLDLAGIEEDSEEEGLAEPISLRVLGSGADASRPLVLAFGSRLLKCGPGLDPGIPCERGAEVEGGVPPLGALHVCGQPYPVARLDSCPVDPFAVGEYTIEYRVADFSQAVATATRHVHVRHTDATCPAGERACAGGLTCSEDGVCAGDLAAGQDGDEDVEEVPVDNPPEVALVTNAFVGKSVRVRQYSAYAPCTAETGFVATEAVICDPGATAVDDRDGNITVYACPPDSCVETGSACDGYEYDAIGLDACKVDTSNLGRAYEIRYVSRDSATPPNVVTATRTVTIVPPCDGDAQWCAESDAEPWRGLCSDVPCALRSQLKDQEGPEDVGPVIYVVGPEAFDVNYLQPSPRGVGVCASKVAGEAQAQRFGAWDCAAYAVDDFDGDVASLTSVREATCDGMGDGCRPCGPGSLAEGSVVSCTPGVYRFEYTSSDTLGLPARARVISVRVVEAATLTATFDIRSTALLRSTAEYEALEVKDPSCHPAVEGSRTGLLVCLRADAMRNALSIVTGQPAMRIAFNDATVLNSAYPFELRVSYAIVVTATGNSAIARRALSTNGSSTGSESRSSALVAAESVSSALVGAAGQGALGALISAEATARGIAVGDVDPNSVPAPEAEATTAEVDAQLAQISSLVAALEEVELATDRNLERVAAMQQGPLATISGALSGSALDSAFAAIVQDARANQLEASARADEVAALFEQMLRDLDELAATQNATAATLAADIATRHEALQSLVARAQAVAGRSGQGGQDAPPTAVQPGCRRDANGDAQVSYTVDSGRPGESAGNEAPSRTGSGGAQVRPTTAPSPPPVPCAWYGNFSQMPSRELSALSDIIARASERLYDRTFFLDMTSVAASRTLDRNVSASRTRPVRTEDGLAVTVTLYLADSLESWTGLKTFRTGAANADPFALEEVRVDLTHRAAAALRLNGWSVHDGDVVVESVNPVVSGSADAPRVGMPLRVTFEVSLVRAWATLGANSGCAAPPQPRAESPADDSRPLWARGRRMLSSPPRADEVFATRDDRFSGGYDLRPGLEVDAANASTVSSSTYSRPRSLGSGPANRIIGGVLVSSERRVRACGKEHERAHASVRGMGACLGGRETAPFGSNPMFRANSDLRDVELLPLLTGAAVDAAAAQYFNATTEVSPGSGIPYAFFSGSSDAALRGVRAVGSTYPVYFDGALTNAAAGRLFDYLEDGYFVDRSTVRVSVDAIVHNVETNTVCRVTAAFLQRPEGGVSSLPTVDCAPLVRYETVGEIALLVAEIAYTLFLLALCAKQFRKALRVVMSWENRSLVALRRKIEETKAIVMGAAGGGGKPDPSKRDEGAGEQGMRVGDSVKHLSFALLSFAQLFAMTIWWVYALGFSLGFAYDARYQWYDGDASSAARPLLVLRDGPPETFGSLRSPGSGRHTLPADTAQGVERYLDLVSNVETLIDLFSAYFYVSGLLIVVLLVQVLAELDFSAKFRIITRTLVKMLPDMGAIAVIVIILLTCFSAYPYLVMGERVALFSRLNRVIELLFEVPFGETVHMAEFRSGPAILSVWEEASQALFFYGMHFLLLFMLLQFPVAIIMDVYYFHALRYRDRPGLGSDLRELVVNFDHVWLQQRLSTFKIAHVFRVLERAYLSKRSKMTAGAFLEEMNVRGVAATFDETEELSSMWVEYSKWNARDAVSEKDKQQEERARRARENVAVRAGTMYVNKELKVNRHRHDATQLSKILSDFGDRYGGFVTSKASANKKEPPKAAKEAKEASKPAPLEKQTTFRKMRQVWRRAVHRVILAGAFRAMTAAERAAEAEAARKSHHLVNTILRTFGSEPRPKATKRKRPPRPERVLKVTLGRLRRTTFQLQGVGRELGTVADAVKATAQATTKRR